MRESTFRFKQFSVRQQNTAMKIGTDGVLLGAWADFRNAQTILDIGTGTGVIALMAAQRMPDAMIDAIEIDGDAYEESLFNVNNSLWSNRIRVINGSILEYNPTKKYDSLICNPPFFESSTLNPNEGRTKARHCVELSHEQLVRKVADLLSDNGNFNLILPTQESVKIDSIAKVCGLYITRRTHVLPTPQKAPKRVLLELSTKERPCEENELVVELGRHVYSEEYRQITMDFYLDV